MPAPPFAACAPSRLYTPRLCPICNGNPTRVSAAALAKLCQRYKGSCSSCATCTPESLPPELTIIDQPLEEIMGERKTVYQPCELCGDMKNTKTNNGKMVCCNCEPVWRMVNHKPEVVFESLRDRMGISWLRDLASFPALAEDDNPAAVPSWDDMVELREELNAAYAKIREMDDAFDKQVTHNGEAFREIARLEHACEVLESKVHALPAITPTRDTAVLNIALQVIAGEITGITAADLAALR